MKQLRYQICTIFLLLLMLLVLPLRRQVVIAEQHAQTLREVQTRKLQDDDDATVIYNYRANYTADFQHIADPSCIMGDAPVLIISCLFSQRMTILRRSSESIICNATTIPRFQGDTSYECRSTCNSTATCQNVYLSTQEVAPMDGSYGSIQFMCEGNTVRDVDAAFNYSAGAPGSCFNNTRIATSPESYPPRTLHVAKLGISCPMSDGRRDYVYDDTYFECTFLGSPAIAGISFDSVGDPDDVYTCLTGGACRDTNCPNLPFKDIIVESVVPNFFSDCVETTIAGGSTAIPSQSPIVPVATAGDVIYTVRFEALWGQLYIPNTTLETCVNFDNASSGNENKSVAVISCGNGATAIRLYTSTDPVMNCITINDIELHCTGAERQIKNQFTSVTYDCYGGDIPTSQVTYPESTVSCNDINTNAFLRNSVILGLACDGGPNLYPDAFVECADSHHQFFVSKSGEFNLPYDRYICSESVFITDGSSVSDIYTIPSVSIITDSLWLRDPSETKPCVNEVDSIPAPTPFIVPVVAPSISPDLPFAPMTITTTTPIASTPVSNSPVDPNLPILIVPVPVSTPSTTTVPTAPIQTSDGIGSSVFAVIGGIAGGIAISVIVLFVYLKGKRDGTKQHSQKDCNDAGAAASQSGGDTEHDHLTRTSGSTNKRSSSSASASAATPTTNTSSDEPPSQAILIPSITRPTTSVSAATVPSNAYSIDYKDQARSVVHARPVKNTLRHFGGGEPTQNMPIAMAVPMIVATDTSTAAAAAAANEGTVIQSNRARLVANSPLYDV